MSTETPENSATSHSYVSSAFLIAAIFVVIYILSPIPVLRFVLGYCPSAYDEVCYFYLPLIYLADRFQPVATFYDYLDDLFEAFIELLV
ncbi:MAG: hypothetical protein KDA78_01335 [Planctomycetaceae bacterium]|nr:hypothetical protein [Planctomycetaceae bacterium]